MRTTRSSSCPGGSPPGTPREQTPPSRHTPPWSRHPPCEQNSWHTPMKILPCPKLRLRAVINRRCEGTLMFYIIFPSWMSMSNAAKSGLSNKDSSRTTSIVQRTSTGGLTTSMSTCLLRKSTSFQLCYATSFGTLRCYFFAHRKILLLSSIMLREQPFHEPNCP